MRLLLMCGTLKEFAIRSLVAWISSSCSIIRESSVRKRNVPWQPRLRSFMGLFPSQLVCDGYVTSPACSPQTFARPPNISKDSARQNLDFSSSQLIETEWGDKGGHSGLQRGIQPGSIVHNCWPQKRRNSRFQIKWKMMMLRRQLLFSLQRKEHTKMAGAMIISCCILSFPINNDKLACFNINLFART